MKCDMTLSQKNSFGSPQKSGIFVKFTAGPSARRRPQKVPLGCILKYSEELKQGTNTETGPKNFFETTSWPTRCGGYPYSLK